MMKKAIALFCALLLLTALPTLASASILDSFFGQYNANLDALNAQGVRTEPAALPPEGDSITARFDAGSITVNTRTDSIEELRLVLMVGNYDNYVYDRAVAAAAAAETALGDQSSTNDLMTQVFYAIDAMSDAQGERLAQGEEVGFLETDRFVYAAWSSEQLYKDLGLELTPYAALILRAK